MERKPTTQITDAFHAPEVANRLEPADTIPTAASLWAKLKWDCSQRIMGWHSLVDHSCDVAAVIAALLAQPTINQRLAAAAGRTELDAVICARLAALSFLHDIGKANRGFRRRVDPQAPKVGHIDQLSWVFSSGFPLAERLETVLGLERMETWFASDGAQEIWDAIFAHHGRPWSKEPADARAHWRPKGLGSDPMAELAPQRGGLDAWFAVAFTPDDALPGNPEFHHAFAGLLMLADWLGSDTRFFPFANGSSEDRMRYAELAAPRALREVGLSVEERRGTVQHRRLAFADLFAGSPPRHIQQDAILPTANCVVLEAETGSGKTEAALWRFQHLFATGAVDGLYFALPTRVAASQMFAGGKRVGGALFPPADRRR